MKITKILKKQINEIYLKCFFLNFEKITRYKSEKKRFSNKLGYNLNLKNPQSFNQKVVYKKIKDRNPLLPITADKFLVKNYIREKLGADIAGDVIVPTLFVTSRPESIPFDELPERFIVKANHGSGWNILVDNKEDINHQQIIEKCKDWLKTPFGLRKHEWAYQKIRRKIIIEPLLTDEKGKIPKDYKLLVFHGKCKSIQVDFDRFESHSRSFFNENWQFINATSKTRQGPKIKKPKGFNLMVTLAEKIGEDFDFVRVDFYSVKGNVFIGELTHYPGSGTDRFYPQEYDFELGKMWEIKNNYWKNKKPPIVK